LGWCEDVDVSLPWPLDIEGWMRVIATNRSRHRPGGGDHERIAVMGADPP